MNARLFVVSRALSGLFVVAITLLASGCATPLYVPSETARYGGYTTTGSYGYGQLPPREVVRRDPATGGCIATRYDTAIPFSVAVPCVQPADANRGQPYSSPGGNYERSRYDLSILQGMLVTANQQLAEVCDPKTINSRAAAEALVTSAIVGAIGRTSQAVVGGAAVGTLSGYARGGAACQRTVDWHHELLLELSKEVRYQREVVGPKCRHGLSERTGQQTIRSKECDETEYGSWRNKK